MNQKPENAFITSKKKNDHSQKSLQPRLSDNPHLPVTSKPIFWLLNIDFRLTVSPNTAILLS